MHRPHVNCRLSGCGSLSDKNAGCPTLYRNLQDQHPHLANFPKEFFEADEIVSALVTLRYRIAEFLVVTAKGDNGDGDVDLTSTRREVIEILRELRPRKIGAVPRWGCCFWSAAAHRRKNCCAEWRRAVVTDAI